MLDTVFGIFNNVSPCFQWPEIDLQFPGDNEFFTIANFDEMAAKQAMPRCRMKVKDAFLLLFSPPEKAYESLNVLRSDKITAFDMQILVHCQFHVECIQMLRLTCFRSLRTCLVSDILQSLDSSPRRGYPGHHGTFQISNGPLENALG
jgi:hypothetical protein